MGRPFPPVANRLNTLLTVAECIEALDLLRLVRQDLCDYREVYICNSIERQTSGDGDVGVALKQEIELRLGLGNTLITWYDYAYGEYMYHPACRDYRIDWVDSLIKELSDAHA